MTKTIELTWFGKENRPKLEPRVASNARIRRRATSSPSTCPIGRRNQRNRREMGNNMTEPIITYPNCKTEIKLTELKIGHRISNWKYKGRS